LMVWTVNKPEHMMEAVRWQVDVIITDVTKTWLDLRTALQNDYEKIVAQYGRIFLWTSLRFYTPFRIIESRQAKGYLERIAGSFDAITNAPVRIEA